jgi:hypothetical protein
MRLNWFHGRDKNTHLYWHPSIDKTLVMAIFSQVSLWRRNQLRYFTDSFIILEIYAIQYQYRYNRVLGRPDTSARANISLMPVVIGRIQKPDHTGFEEQQIY